MTAKDLVSREDRFFLVQGSDDSDCYRKFREFSTNAKERLELGLLDIRTVKYLGDGPESNSVKITNKIGITELDTSNNCGYGVKVFKDGY